MGSLGNWELAERSLVHRVRIFAIPQVSLLVKRKNTGFSAVNQALDNAGLIGKGMCSEVGLSGQRELQLEFSNFQCL